VKIFHQRLKIYIVDWGGGGGGGGVNQPINSKISPNYVSFIFTKVKCIVTLLENIYK
jgi:hypothetical protein